MMNEPTRTRPSFSDSFAHAIRIISIPPLMVAVIFLLLYVRRPELFLSPADFWLSELFLAFVPILAYPVSVLVPSIRAKGRNGQRNLAMYFSAAGYLAVVLYGIFADCTEGLKVIHLTYLLSVVLLLVLNKLVHVRASGHACSVSGPILLLCLYIGAVGSVVGILLWSLIFWASIKTRRHTPKEFLIGSVTPIVAYILSYFLYALI